MGRTLLRFERVGIDILAAPALEGGDSVGADALGHALALQAERGVTAHGATVAAHGHARHTLHAAGHDQVVPTRRDLGQGWPC